MEESSILKRSVKMVGLFLGVSTVWVLLVSLALGAITDKVLGSSSEATALPESASDGTATPTHPRGSPKSAPQAPKPNG